MLQEIGGRRRILMPLIIKGRDTLCIQGAKSAGRNLRIRKVCDEDMERIAGH